MGNHGRSLGFDAAKANQRRDSRCFGSNLTPKLCAQRASEQGFHEKSEKNGNIWAETLSDFPPLHMVLRVTLFATIGVGRPPNHHNI